MICEETIVVQKCQFFD